MNECVMYNNMHINIYCMCVWRDKCLRRGYMKVKNARDNKKVDKIEIEEKYNNSN